MRIHWPLSLCTLALFVGCEFNFDVTGDATTDSSVAESNQTPDADDADDADEEMNATTASQQDSEASPESQSEPPEEEERVVAKAGVGKKGKRLEQEHVNRAIVQPIRSLFAFEQKAVFDFQVKPALNLYKGTNGSLPASHEEFMTEIIQANNIRLPELPQGERYEWDPKEEQLYVVRPKS